MNSGRTPVLKTLAGLFVTSFAFLYANGVLAEDYASLPASAEETTPLKTGDRAPSFTVRTVDDEPYVFDPDNLENPTILVSFRGGWCPYCNLHLSELRTVIPSLREKGFDVLFLSNDRPDLLYSSLMMETKEDIEGLDYVILSDANIEAAMALGTAFRTEKGLSDYLEGKNRDYAGSSIARHTALAVPAVYMISREGEIVYDFVNADYKVRLPADEMLETATKLLTD